MFLFHENRKQKIKSNMFSEFKFFENENSFKKIKQKMKIKIENTN